MPKARIPFPSLDRLEAIAVKLERDGSPSLAREVRGAIEDLARHQSGSDPSLVWTRERPTKAGWYWVRDASDRTEGIGGDILYVDRRWRLNDEWEYAGPIPRAVEAKGEASDG